MVFMTLSAAGVTVGATRMHCGAPVLAVPYIEIFGLRVSWRDGGTGVFIFITNRHLLKDGAIKLKHI